MSAAVFVKFSAYAESERNFALNARSAAHCEAISREPKVVILRAVRQIPLKKDHCHSTMVFLVQVTGLEPVTYTRKTRINSIYFETCVAFCVAFCFYP